MIQLKGRQAGSLKCVVPADMSERQMFEGFSSLLSTGSHLLAGSEIEIDLQTRRFSPALLLKIWKTFIEPSGCAVTLWSVSDPQSREYLERMGFRTSAGEYTAERPEKKRRGGRRPATASILASSISARFAAARTSATPETW